MLLIIRVPSRMDLACVLVEQTLETFLGYQKGQMPVLSEAWCGDEME